MCVKLPNTKGMRARVRQTLPYSLQCMNECTPIYLHKTSLIPRPAHLGVRLYTQYFGMHKIFKTVETFNLRTLRHLLLGYLLLGYLLLGYKLS